MLLQGIHPPGTNIHKIEAVMLPPEYRTFEKTKRLASKILIYVNDSSIFVFITTRLNKFVS